MHPRSLAAALALLLAAGPAAAQVPGLPVFNSGPKPGLTVGLDVGFPDEDAGGGNAYAGTVTWGKGPWMLTGTVGTFGPDDVDGGLTLGATGNLQVLGGPLSPFGVTLQAGFGYGSLDDGDLYHAPIGAGLAMVIPSPAVSLKPWIAPRLDLSKVSAEGAVEEDWSSNFGVSAGLDLYFIGGLGLRAAYDHVSGDDVSPGIFSVGLNYAFNIAGF